MRSIYFLGLLLMAISTSCIKEQSASEETLPEATMGQIDQPAKLAKKVMLKTHEFDSVMMELKGQELAIISKKGPRPTIKVSVKGKWGEVVFDKKDHFAFAAVLEQDGVEALSTILFDQKRHYLIGPMTGLDYPSILSISPDGLYIVLDHGTAAGNRQLMLLDLMAGVPILQATYHDSRQPSWSGGHNLIYHTIADPEEAGRFELKDSTNVIIRKMIWRDGDIEATAEFDEVYSE